MKIPRTIHYLNLHVTFENQAPAVQNNLFRELFSTITQMAAARNPLRFVKDGAKTLYINQIQFHGNVKQIHGILRLIRRDAPPELFNSNNDETREIELLENESLVENTHFIIDYSKKNKVLVLESNLHGAKIKELITYLEKIGREYCNLQSVVPIFISANNLTRMQEVMQKVSTLTMKVHKDNISMLSNMDSGLASNLQSLRDYSQSDYVEIVLNCEVRKRQETNVIREKINNIVNWIRRDARNQYAFNTLSIKAQSSENLGNLEFFDLLVDKINSQIKVEIRPNSRAIVSSFIFEKMQNELIRKRII